MTSAILGTGIISFWPYYVPLHLSRSDRGKYNQTTLSATGQTLGQCVAGSSLWERESGSMIKEMFSQRIMWKALQGASRAWRLGGGHTMEEEPGTSISGSRLGQSEHKQRMAGKTSKAREVVRGQMITDCDMHVLLLYHGMLWNRILGYHSESWGAVWNILTVYKWYSWTCVSWVILRNDVLVFSIIVIL